MSYSASGLPPGISFDGLTRTFSGVPTQAGVFAVQVVATDSGSPPLSVTNQFTLTVDRKPLTISLPLVTKLYDGTTAPGAVTVGVLSGLVGSETLNVAGSATAYPGRNVGAAYSVTVSYNLADGSNGGLAANYSLADSLVTNATIVVRPLTVTAVASSKIYDGTTNAPGVPTHDPLQSGDGTTTFGETFNDPNVGSNKTLASRQAW